MHSTDTPDNSTASADSSNNNSTSSSSTVADLTYTVLSSDGQETSPNVTGDDILVDESYLSNTTTVAMVTDKNSEGQSESTIFACKLWVQLLLAVLEVVFFLFQLVSMLW